MVTLFLISGERLEFPDATSVQPRAPANLVGQSEYVFQCINADLKAIAWFRPDQIIGYCIDTRWQTKRNQGEPRAAAEAHGGNDRA